MPLQEVWQWVHSSYGQELGLTTDDEDYVEPEEDKVRIFFLCTKKLPDLQDFAKSLNFTVVISKTDRDNVTNITFKKLISRAIRKCAISMIIRASFRNSYSEN